MATPTDKFLRGYEPNRVWKGPTPDIADLHTHFSRAYGGDRSLSCWELEPGEYQEVVRTGKVYLHVYGMHPPVYVSSALDLMFGDAEIDEPSVLARMLSAAGGEELKMLQRRVRQLEGFLLEVGLDAPEPEPENDGART